MAINCTRCEGTGFLNLHQIPDDEIEELDNDIDKICAWIDNNDGHDVQICDCCGDGEGWYGVPGEHYNSEDPIGRNGPYASNGGLCKCH